ncbi:hypothetical protein ACHAW6_015124 [Cyclotella cf. meneghiniana]
MSTAVTAGQCSQSIRKRSVRPLPKRNPKCSTTSRPKGTKTKEKHLNLRSRPHNAPKHKANVAEEQRAVPCTNAIDEVLSESDDLLQCAFEAQALGRLNEAQSYLYLAHARLVGLGRFIEKENVDEESEDCLSKKGYEDRNGAFSVTNHDGFSCVEQKSTPDGGTTILTPHAGTLSLKPKITPSPMSTAHLPMAEGNNNLSGYLAQSAQNLLYKQKGIGNKFAVNIERKADQNSRRKSRAKSFDSDVKEDSNLQRESIVNLQVAGTRDKRDSDDANLSESGVLSASLMTANHAVLDVRTLMEKGTAALC